MIEYKIGFNTETFIAKFDIPSLKTKKGEEVELIVDDCGVPMLINPTFKYEVEKAQVFHNTVFYLIDWYNFNIKLNE